MSVIDSAVWDRFCHDLTPPTTTSPFPRGGVSAACPRIGMGASAAWGQYRGGGSIGAITSTDSDIPIRFQTLVQRIQVVSVRIHYFLISLNIILVAMAIFLDKLENKVQIHHLYIKCFHMVKRLQKLVQYIRRYSTKYAEPREHATQFRHT